MGDCVNRMAASAEAVGRDDIVTRLRIIHCSKDEMIHCGTCLPCRAADEIESLRKELNIYKDLYSEELNRNKNEIVKAMRKEFENYKTELYKTRQVYLQESVLKLGDESIEK